MTVVDGDCAPGTDSSETVTCETQDCPGNVYEYSKHSKQAFCNYKYIIYFPFASEWNTWSYETCSVSCDTGVQDKTRECIDHTGATVTDTDCSDEASDQTETCETQSCPGDT